MEDTTNGNIALPMTTLVTPELRAWIGRSAPTQRVEITRRDIVKYSLATEQQAAKFLTGDEAPPMFLFAADRPLSGPQQLGPDGLAADVLLPRLPLPRVMAGGIKQRYHRVLKPGDVVFIKRTLTDIYEKQGASGPLIFIVYALEVTDADGERVLEETQTRINR